MIRITFASLALITIAATGAASDPTSGRAAKKTTPGKMTLPAPHYLEGHWPQYFPIEEKTPSDRVIEIITWPARQIVPGIESLLRPKSASDPNFRMTQLLNESPELQQARAEMHRFWMNNQPSVLSYERLKGAIGP
jgi:hypothetical protein